MVAAVVLSADQARRVALAAQGLAGPAPPGAVDRRHARRVFDHVGVIQIDSVNVVCRSQELPLFARLGPHRRDLIESMTAAGEVFEYWAHEASHVPVGLHPLLRWRMADAGAGRGTWSAVAKIAQDHPRLVASALAQIDERGPMTTSMLEGGGDRTQGMWGWSPGKMALEHLFWSGRITARRGRNFERWYDLAERMLPADVLDAPTPTPSEAKRELLIRAARSHGVGTARDLADYFRLNIVESRGLLAELVASGRLHAAEVEGWAERAYLDPGARRPRAVCGAALLSPFDSLVWERARTERLWGFRYRLEIYTPRTKRLHGYYVLPFLLDGHLVARVDLKADRVQQVLRVQGAFGEPEVGADADRRAAVGSALRTELERLSGHLGLDGVEVVANGDLAASVG